MTGTKEDRSYIKKLLLIAIPIIVQNGISNFVNLLDNLMIGRVGTNALSGVAIANQLIFVFYLVIFGATAGAGIFTAQFKGNDDNEGIRYTFRFKIVFNTVLAAICVILFAIFSPYLINLFLLGEGDPADAAETLKIGISYIRIILISLIPIGLTQAYAGTLRDLGSTKVPMYASLCAILVNLVGNWILIYGHFGLPALGADGAAIATVISRFVELAILIVYTGRHSATLPFIKGAFKNFRVPGVLVKKFILKSLPLMANETLWSLGMTVINQSYSYRSLDAVAAMNIQSTIWNVMGVSFLAMGEAVGIMMGHILGSGELDTAKILLRFVESANEIFVLRFLYASVTGNAISLSSRVLRLDLPPLSFLFFLPGILISSLLIHEYIGDLSKYRYTETILYILAALYGIVEEIEQYRKTYCDRKACYQTEQRISLDIGAAGTYGHLRGRYCFNRTCLSGTLDELGSKIGDILAYLSRELRHLTGNYYLQHLGIING